MRHDVQQDEGQCGTLADHFSHALLCAWALLQLWGGCKQQDVDWVVDGAYGSATRGTQCVFPFVYNSETYYSPVRHSCCAFCMRLTLSVNAQIGFGLSGWG